MIAIILAAGRGVRMAPLTNTSQKAMLTVLGKNLIEWKLEALPPVDTIVLVVGYMKEQVTNYFGTTWRGVPIIYVEHTTLNGTGGAVALCESYVTDTALVLMGDDIYNKDDLQKLVAHDYAMLVLDEGEAGLKKKAQVVEKDGLLIGLNEGTIQTGTPSPLINTGAYVISKDYFRFPLVEVFSGEYGLPQTMAAHSNDTPVTIVRASWWIQITSPDSLATAEHFLAENINGSRTPSL